MKPIKSLFNKVKTLILAMRNKIKEHKNRERKPHPRRDKAVAFMNKYSLVFHYLLSCFLIFVIESISRRNIFSALSFIGGHTLAYFYNSFIIFASLSLAYLVRRRALARLLISGFWIFLGTVNGVILSKRVTPFGYTDMKCLEDLFAMQNTSYFTAKEATIVVFCVGAFVAFCIAFFIKGPKYQGKSNKLTSLAIVAGSFLLLPVTTSAAQTANVVDSYFSNIAQGYENYGFVYGFSSSVVDRGMSEPKEYSQAKIASIMASLPYETSEIIEDAPNIVVVLLESFIDPYEINYLNFSEDPIPNFRNLYNNYSSGYLKVPVVGAGTANTEFEVLTGMSMRFFGTGEYPYKTTLKQTDAESIASVLSSLGYGTHAVHNNGGNFYSRANAFSMMGFDTFTSKESMNIQEYTPLGSWPTDNILIDETIKTMDATPDQPDFVYTITVQGHGDYPREKILENPEITVTGAADEGSNNAWEYYVNQIHEVDKFIGNLIAELDARGEKTMVVFFGDHLPSMNIEEEETATGDIFKTKYATWNNFGLMKQDMNCSAYQLMANITNQLGIHKGTMFNYTQQRMTSPTYFEGLEQLQYDLLYGDRYAYYGVDKYPATDIVMGIDDVVIKKIYEVSEDHLFIYGENFTPWTKIYVNGEKISTTFLGRSVLKIKRSKVEDGDILTANIVGSSSTIFRTSNEVTYVDPNVVHDTEADVPATEGSTESTEQSSEQTSEQTSEQAE